MQKIVKGDNVKILLGKDEGKTGNVGRVLAKEGKVFVEGINITKRHVRRQGQVEGGIIDLIKPVNISNVALICPNCKKPTRVGFLITDKGKKRICRKCKKEIGK
jgi:large subunit ribosomal protein L24